MTAAVSAKQITAEYVRPPGELIPTVTRWNWSDQFPISTDNSIIGWVQCNQKIFLCALLSSPKWRVGAR